MTKFSANLGFLWAELPLVEAVFKAKAAGFEALEFHWPYDVPVEVLRSAVDEAGLPVMGLNTRRGDVAGGENGLSALTGREEEARAAIDEAVEYGAKLGAKAVHVMAGFAEGETAGACFVDNLKYACDRAAKHDMTILIEPLNHYDAPGYFLSTTDKAVEIIEAVGSANLKLMFDCYHVQLMEGDLSHRLERLLPLIGHVQFASVPARGAPNQGEINYRHIFETLNNLGYDAPLGAEYKTAGKTDDTLGWMTAL